VSIANGDLLAGLVHNYWWGRLFRPGGALKGRDHGK
jgi:hypothetical protein